MKNNTFMNEYDHLLRVVILGNTAVGKVFIFTIVRVP